MTYRLVLAASTLFVAGAADAPKEDAPLDGTWTVSKIGRGGRKPPEELLKSLKVVIKGDVLEMTDGKRGEPATFTLEPSATPKEIDLVFKEGPDGSVERTALGIYELDGDELKFAWRKDGGPRPKEFASISGERTSELLILVRAKVEP